MTVSEEAKTLIAQEEEHVYETLDTIKGQISHASRRFETERSRARVLTSDLVAARRVEDKAMMASDEALAHAMTERKVLDLKTLEKQLDNPYFARFVVEEQNDKGELKQFEYKLGTSANTDCRIIDWRKAPISKLYYEYREGDDYSETIQGKERIGKIVLRNAVSIDDERLIKLSCRHGTYVREKDDWKVLSGSGHGAGERESYGKLPPILSLITAEQFRAITEDADTAVLIQGIAGSGKTVVALHRLAWLLHADNSDIQPNECVVLVMTNGLKYYVQNSLPGLDVMDVKVLTFHEWAAGAIAAELPHLKDDAGGLRRPSDKAPLSIQRVKRSLALLQCLEMLERKRRDEFLERLEKEVPTEQLPSGVIELISSAKKRSAPTNTLRRALLDAVERGRATIPPQHPRYEGLLQLKRVLDHEQVATMNLEDSIIDLLSYPSKILEHDETRLLDAALITAARDRAIKNKEEGVLDFCDDGLFLRLIQLEYGIGGKLKHIVADEVQDLGPTELAAIIGSVPQTMALTLVGDTAQSTSAGGTFPGWEKLRSYWDLKESVSKFMKLTVSHRSTLPIMKFAEHVQGTQTVTQGRPGRVPIWFACSKETEGVENLITWLGKAAELYPHGLTAVVCASHRDAKYVLSLLQPTFGAAARLGDNSSFSFEEGILVTEVAEVKGLEFTNVVVWNVSNTNYPDDPTHRNLLYIAATRAQENLCLITWRGGSKLLPHRGSQLVRLVEPETEEQT